MCKSKLYFLFLILIYNISSITSLIANEDINFNLGRIIEENTISKIDDASDKINSEFTILNLDQVIKDEIINKINSNNTINSNRNINDQSTKSIISSNRESKFLKYFNFKNNPINWYNSYLSESEIQNRIIAQDISISPSSVNLPNGNGTVEMGEKVYQAKCLSCHGTEGKAEELDQEIESLRGNQNSIKIIAFESLSGGLGSLNSEIPIRSVGSFWQHSTTLFDYIRRAMPYFEPQSLTNDEAYAVTAYVLFINNIITKDQNINADTLQKINMPNKAGFIDSWGPDWKRSWIHQKYSIIFTCFLLIGILLVILFARKLTQNKKQIKK